MRFNKISLAAMVLGGGMLLSACGGDGDTTSLQPATVAAADISATIDKTTGPAAVDTVLNEAFTFASGVADLGTTASTTLTLSGSSAAPTFTLNSGGFEAKGDMSYGSCIFKINSSNFLPAATFPRLQVGQITTIEPCKITIPTAGQKAGVTDIKKAVKFFLRNSLGLSGQLSIVVNADGTVTVKSKKFGTVTLVISTGATGAGG